MERCSAGAGDVHGGAVGERPTRRGRASLARYRLIRVVELVRPLCPYAGVAIVRGGSNSGSRRLAGGVLDRFARISAVDRIFEDRAADGAPFGRRRRTPAVWRGCVVAGSAARLVWKR